MTADLQTFDISELAASAGVTQRTVRYYVQQGLIDAPGGRGPGTRYDREHLDRLKLIRRLQRQHLPLAEIRRRLEGLGERGVREALASLPDEGDEHSSALDYVRAVLTSQPRVRERPAAKSAPPALLMMEKAMPLFMGSAPAPHPQPAGTAEKRSTWERIVLAPDVEIHVRRPLSREQNRQLERLMEVARNLFSEEL